METKQATDQGVVFRVGNLTREVELRFSPNGHPVANTRIAVDTRGVDGAEKTTAYYSITIWRDLAEHAAETLRKGDRVMVMGRGEVKTWTGKDGQERTDRVITADAIGPDLRFARASIEKVERKVVPEPEHEEEAATYSDVDF